MIGASLAEQSTRDGFLRSALTANGRGLALPDFFSWFEAQRAAQPMKVQRVPLASLDGWQIDGTPLRLAHRSGKFFSIEGIRVVTDFGAVRGWDQPIINQKEIGVLGIITRLIGGVRHFLMQAKVEPGNIDGVQLSPTVQATRSNFTRVHGGAGQPYLEYFVSPGRARVLVDQLQGEQGSRFLRKRNRNMIVEVDDGVPLDDRFCWLTLGQIKRLLECDNIVNMDVRTILACLPLVDSDAFPFADGDEMEDLAGRAAVAPVHGFARELLRSLVNRRAALHTTTELLHWLTGLRVRYTLDLAPQPLDALRGWTMTADEVSHDSGLYFSVIGVDVDAPGREVAHWQQVLLEHGGFGLNGFVMKRVNGVLHFLVRACMYPGNHELFELGSTVSRSNADVYFGKPNAPRFLDLFHEPPAEWVRYDAVQSEEGGRFFHYQNRYTLLELPEDVQIEEPESHRWMTLRQVQNFVRHGYFNIEGRNLLACLDLSAREDSHGAV